MSIVRPTLNEGLLVCLLANLLDLNSVRQMPLFQALERTLERPETKTRKLSRGGTAASNVTDDLEMAGMDGTEGSM